MRKKSTAQSIVIGKRVFSVLLSLLFIFAMLYVYFISSSIVNILVREDTEQDIAEISSQISGLEARYLELKNEITIEYAYAKGFHDVADKQFTARASLAGRGLSFNDQETR